MRNNYGRLTSRWWLLLLWMLETGLSTRAQSTQPSTVQWQQTFPGNEDPGPTTIRVVKAASGEFVVLTGTNVVRLSATGAVVWTTPVPGAPGDSTAGRVPVGKALTLTVTPRNGVAVLAVDQQRRYYVTQFDAGGGVSWTKTIGNANVGQSVALTHRGLTLTPDGGLLVVGTFYDGQSYLTLTKLNREGLIAAQWRIYHTHPATSAAGTPVRTLSAVPVIHQLLATADGGYLLIGQTADKQTGRNAGLALKLDNQYRVVWQGTYPALAALHRVVANAAGASLAGETYTAVGSGQAITVAPNGPEDGQPAFRVPETPVALATDPGGKLTVLDAVQAGQTDFRLINLSAQAGVRWRQSIGGSGRATDLLATDDGGYLAVGTTLLKDTPATGTLGGAETIWLTKVGSSAGAGTLAQPGLGEPTAGLALTVLGNPVRDRVTVEITGAGGQALLLRLLDSRGRVVENRHLEQAGPAERQTFDLREEAPGPLLVQTIANGQIQTAKVIRQ